MSAPPGNEQRPGMETEALETLARVAHRVPADTPSTPDPHCCQSLGLSERKLASELGLHCGPDRCARRALSTFMVMDDAPPAVVDTEGREVVRDQVRELSPLRVALVEFVGEDPVPQVVCRTCDTSTSPWTCSCGLTRFTLQGWS